MHIEDTKIHTTHASTKLPALISTYVYTTTRTSWVQLPDFQDTSDTSLICYILNLVCHSTSLFVESDVYTLIPHDLQVCHYIHMYVENR